MIQTESHAYSYANSFLLINLYCTPVTSAYAYIYFTISVTIRNLISKINLTKKYEKVRDIKQLLIT